jgi:hypothetical protein
MGCISIRCAIKYLTMGNHSDRPELVKSSIIFRWADSPQPIGIRTEDDGFLHLHRLTMPAVRVADGPADAM